MYGLYAYNMSVEDVPYHILLDHHDQVLQNHGLWRKKLKLKIRHLSMNQFPVLPLEQELQLDNQ